MTRTLGGGYLVVAVVLALSAVAVGVEVLTVSTKSASANGSPLASAAADQSVPDVPTLAEPDPLDLASVRTALIFGDSWTYGVGAPSKLGYADLLGAAMGWETVVAGGPGTGYLNPGPEGMGTFAERILTLPDQEFDLVIMQGSVNDAWLDRSGLYDAAAMTMIQMGKRFPAAQIVIIGPAPATLPAGVRLEDVEKKMSAAARSAGLNYISPMNDDWITQSNIGKMIDPAQGNHPSVVGHAYLSDRVATALNELRQ